MKAIVVETPGDIEALQLRDVPEPHVGPRDVLIQVDSCGVCYHDVLVRNGVLKRGVRLPLIPGHEIAGVVIGVGSDVPTFRPGDRVTTTQRYHICGHCSHCRTNHETQCEEKKFLGDWGMFGGYAERVAVEVEEPEPEGVLRVWSTGSKMRTDYRRPCVQTKTATVPLMNRPSVAKTLITTACVITRKWWTHPLIPLNLIH